VGAISSADTGWEVYENIYIFKFSLLSLSEEAIIHSDNGKGLSAI